MVTSTPVPLFAASLTAYPSLGDSLIFQLNGLAVVFSALGLIWGLLETMGRLFRFAARQRERTTALSAKSAVENPAMISSDHLPGEVVAAITASVAVVCEGTRYHIAAITPREPELDWAREGRRAIFASHRMH